MCPAVRSIRPEYGHLLLEVRHLELKKYNRSSIKGDENHMIQVLLLHQVLKGASNNIWNTWFYIFNYSFMANRKRSISNK